MTTRLRNRTLALAGVLAALLFFTRYSYFGLSAYCANASLAVFLLGGFYLRRHQLFAGFLAFALLIDALALWQGHVSAALFTRAYLFEPLAYALLWYGAARLALRARAPLALCGGMLLLATLAFTLTNGSFYWLSGFFPGASMSGWAADFARWAPLFVGTTIAYVALVMGGVEAARRIGARRATAGSVHGASRA